MRGISKFERRILVALLLTGLVPFLVWVAVAARLLLDPPMVIHRQVGEQYQTARLFYRQFIDAKKNEFSARADSIARDEVLRNAIDQASLDDARYRLGAIVEDYESIRSITIYSPDGHRMVNAEGPDARMSDEFAARTYKVPLGLGDAPSMDIVFLLPVDYKKKREQLQQFYEAYEVALTSGSEQQRISLVRFAAITSAILLVALALGFMLARRVTKRIARMAEATERVGQGDLDIVLPLSGNDEITDLTAAFNRMVAEVASARDRIVYLEKVSGWQDLARRLAHEIKNPLTPIQLAIQELSRRVPEDGDPSFKRLVEDSVDVVKEEIGALTRLVDEFSQFARLPEVSPETLELRKFIEEFLDAYNRFEPDAEVTFEAPDRAVMAGIDRVLMRRVLANLSMNAIQAAGAGRAELTITVTLDDDNNQVVVRLEDNGPGVPPENAARIFEPYFTTKSEGTGLGLAIVKKIVLQHRGSIALEPASAGGAAFVIELPLAERAK